MRLDLCVLLYSRLYGHVIISRKLQFMRLFTVRFMRCARKFYFFGLKCVCSSYCFYADHTIYEFCNLNRIITETTEVEGTGLQTRCLNMSKPGKHEDDDSRDWTIGSLGQPKTQKVQRFHQLSFSYASIMLSLRYYLCLFYTNYASTKKQCYVVSCSSVYFFLLKEWGKFEQ